MKYFEIGEIFIVKDQEYIVLKNISLDCKNCDFLNKEECFDVICYGINRRDRNNIIFKLLEKMEVIDKEKDIEELNLKNSEVIVNYCFTIDNDEYEYLNDKHKRVLEIYLDNDVFNLETIISTKESIYRNSISTIKEFFSKKGILLKNINIEDIYIVSFKYIDSLKKIEEYIIEDFPAEQHPIKLKKWVEDNNITVGTEVRIVRKIESRKNGWEDSWVPDMNYTINKIGKIERIDRANICVRINNTFYGYSFQSLEKPF